LPPVRFVVRAANGTFAPPSDEQRWGAEDVVLRIERPWALRLLLVRRGGGEPIPGHAVVAPRGLERFTIEGDGRAVVGPLRPGPVRLVVVPDDRRWTPRALDVDETTADVRVAVEPTTPIQVLARDARGEPLPDVVIRLVGRRF